MIEPTIVELPAKTLVGRKAVMNLTNDASADLWKSFMQYEKHIPLRMNDEFISMQVFDHEGEFTPDTQFTKWACVEVNPELANNVKFKSSFPALESYPFKGGMYAIFGYQGLPGDIHKLMNYIHQAWFPQSEFELDEREHFEVLPRNYKPDDPEAKEMFFIPVKAKTTGITKTA